MKKPSTQSMMMGHPVVALPVAVATLATLYAWSQNSEVWWLAIVMLAFMGRVMKANEARRDYLQWKREWDALDPNPAPRMRAVHVAGMVEAPSCWSPERPAIRSGLGRRWAA